MRHVYERDVPMTTRDGVTLLADVWRPEQGTAPVLLLRTPYDKRTSLHLGGPNSQVSPIHFLNAGYAVVMQDARGTATSEGVFEPKVNDLADGEDTVAWIVAQEWSDGTVGTWGASYIGMAQWAMAVAQAPGLKAIAPTNAAANWYSGLWYSQGGAMCLSLNTWWNAIMYAGEEQRALTRGQTQDPSALMGFVGILMDPLVANTATPVADLSMHGHGRWFDDWIAHPDFDDYWKSQDFSTRIADVTVPALLTGGWYDLKVHELVADWVRIRTGGASE